MRSVPTVGLTVPQALDEGRLAPLIVPDPPNLRMRDRWLGIEAFGLGCLLRRQLDGGGVGRTSLAFAFPFSTVPRVASSCRQSRIVARLAAAALASADMLMPAPPSSALSNPAWF